MISEQNLLHGSALGDQGHTINDKQCTCRIQSVLVAEHELETVLLGIRVPMRPVPVAGIVRLILYFARRYAESDGLVRLGSDLSRYEWMALLRGAE